MTERDLTTICDHVNPFSGAESWHGQRLTPDGTSTDWDIAQEDVAEVIGEASTGGEWDGKVAAVLRLNDGRFVAWETFYGPTGDGFIEGAYGGDADLTFASTLDQAVRFGLTDEGRNLLGIPHPEGPPA